MMHTWFECKIRYEKTMENGMNKKVTEPYLVDALSFTEAEARIIEEMTPFISGEFTVSDIKRANYSELFPCEEDAADRWFKCKLFFITLDEKSGAEKKTSTQVLVQAADLRDAVTKLDEGMKGLPEWCKTTITVGGKKVVVDKTGKDTIVTPENESNNDTRRNASNKTKAKKETST